ncbi:hypothetical protein LTR62_004432 [Meristemomyces frigidus]|uniref:K Homology domain-containing protein n=1 Tax=Meristemomyces frigidus TaxID=1508187 RepID=A0AAN7TFK6_9PEZI|nr:hypothetical protein LTR62_004432 [Meristemomyces frigidus]
MNGTVTPNAAEDEELYAQLLRIQDAVLAGRHAQFKLSPSAVEQLKAALIAPDNIAAHATNQAASSVAATINAQLGTNVPTGLDPIFLEKSDHLVKAERALKRQRVEQDVQVQAEQQRKNFRYSKDANIEATSHISVDEVLRAAHERVKPVTGLKSAQAASASSFDENDYYSSRAPSHWSDDANSFQASDKGAGAFTADLERLGGIAQAGHSTRKHGMASQPMQDNRHKPVQVYDGEDDDVYEPEDGEDDEYDPALVPSIGPAQKGAIANGHYTLEDDNSDYEPGEITQDSAALTPYLPAQQVAQNSPRVPVIRNHLTHLAAPQPNRVSPLATATGPGIELELVNGRPEIVQARPQYRSVPQQSRASTASPVNNAGGSGKKKQRNNGKKRKRELEPREPRGQRVKKRQDRRFAHSPVSPVHREPHVKDEPVSPPPFANALDIPQYHKADHGPPPIEVDLRSPARVPQSQHVSDAPRSNLRYEYAAPLSPANVRAASPGVYRPVQRDTQDLRRVANMQYAQRAPSPPTQRAYSPVGPYRAASAVYAPVPRTAEPPRYTEVQPEPHLQYARARSPSRMQEYRDEYSRAASPAIMAPTAQPLPPRIVVDQYGTRYYAAEPVPTPALEHVPESQPVYERDPSRMSVAYAPAPSFRYESHYPRMAPPPTPIRQEPRVEYTRTNGYRAAEYIERQPEPIRYSTAAPTSPRYQEKPRYPMAPPALPAVAEKTSPVYQAMPRYEDMPPPQALPQRIEAISPVYQTMPRYEAMPPPQAPPQRIEATSPVYQQALRAYSVRPEAMQPPPLPQSGYIRQASVVPAQYARGYEMAPPLLPSQMSRAVSVAPGGYGAQDPGQMMYGYAPQAQPRTQAVRAGGPAVMHNISSRARHGWEGIKPSMGFGMSRNGAGPQQSSPADLAALGQQAQTAGRSVAGASMSSNTAAAAGGHLVNLSFNVPFNSNLPGPDSDDVLYSSKGAFQKWIHPDGGAAGEDMPNHALPVHTRNVEILRMLCKQMSESSGERLHATVTSSKPKPVPGMQRGPLTALVTNVCIGGEAEVVHKMRAKVLNETPITLRREIIDIDREIVFPKSQDGARADILHHMDDIADKTKADIFLLESKSRRKDSESASFNGAIEKSMDKRLQIHVYGDMECCENAKTRLLIMIDQILQRQVDTIRLELSLHTLISGRHRRNVKMIESATGTAIYFPPMFPTVFGYVPPGSVPLRGRDEIIITGESMDMILQAKKRLHDLVVSTKTFIKDVQITTSKVDYILLERLDKIRRIIEANGSYVLLPPLGNHSGVLRVQATDILNVERTVREIMGLAGQFYSASWWVTHPDPSQRQPTPSDIRAMLPDICINSGAEITFEKLNFHINGSDDAVKAAMSIINTLPFVKKAQSTLRVKVELANEHKEFVSGKKNGKINKIMSQSNVQIVFDGFNEYNFYIDVRGAQYEATKNGLDLVELEMPASISFHVPDQYHKRIIGIGGQHIQRIMKKYSVFVKFSNAMDRGGIGKDDDDIKVDNVICRTPARNADNLELVKQEIMDMVEKVDAEFVSEHIPVDRLYHRELVARMPEIEELEKKWNCKVTFPGTEQASDMITVSGPEYQVPQAVDEFLGMVPETHEIEFPTTEELSAYLRSDEFTKERLQKLKDQYVVEAAVLEPKHERHGDKEVLVERFTLSYTRNNAGGLKDAIDFLLLPFLGKGLAVDDVKGAIPRPKSDSFEDNMPYFESKLLQQTPASDSPTRASFLAEEGSSRSIFDKLRKPGSMSSFSSFIDRRRKTGRDSPASLFMHASNNASKASLVSMESRDSGYRNPWNDSGVDLEHDTSNGAHHSLHGNGWGSFSTTASRPNTSSNSLSGAFGDPANKFPFGVNGNASSSSLNTPMIPGLGMATTNGSSLALGTTPGDATPRYDPKMGELANGDVPATTALTAPETGKEKSAEGSAQAITTLTTPGYSAPIVRPH